MILIRNYIDSDAIQVGILIADTYSEFNLSFASPEQKRLFWVPFSMQDLPKKYIKKQLPT